MVEEHLPHHIRANTITKVRDEIISYPSFFVYGSLLGRESVETPDSGRWTVYVHWAKGNGAVYLIVE